jgi:hypothetical protein
MTSKGVSIVKKFFTRGIYLLGMAPVMDMTTNQGCDPVLVTQQILLDQAIGFGGAVFDDLSGRLFNNLYLGFLDAIS